MQSLIKESSEVEYNEDHADKFRRIWLVSTYWRIFKKSCKFHKKKRIEEIKRKEIENEEYKTKVAKDFREFSLKTKLFDLLLENLDLVIEENKKYEGKDAMEIKMIKFQENLKKQAKNQNNIIEEESLDKSLPKNYLPDQLTQNQNRLEELERMRQNLDLQKIESETEEKLKQRKIELENLLKQREQKKFENEEETDPALESIEINRDLQLIRSFM